jgi:TonB-dependent starch-binding outer membrane protein SusC
MGNSGRRAIAGIMLLISACARTPGRPGVGAPVPRASDEPDTIPVPYGQQAAAKSTGAVTSVSAEQSNDLRDVLDILGGHVAGLQVTELPNGEIRLRIRGTYQSLQPDDASHQPLLVIDGMPVHPRAIRLALKGLNPHDVESITVLKDLSTTAIYGGLGANGVILIALKR